MEEFVAYLIKNLVNSPDEVSVTSRQEEDVTHIDIRVGAEDIARVIGRKGRTIQAVRTLAGTIAARLKQRVRIEVLED